MKRLSLLSILGLAFVAGCKSTAPTGFEPGSITDKAKIETTRDENGNKDPVASDDAQDSTSLQRRKQAAQSLGLGK